MFAQLDTNGLWYGLLYSNNPTPSGCDRPYLRVSLGGFKTPLAAASAINSKFPNIDSLSQDSLPCDVDLSALNLISCGTEITLVTPADKTLPYVLAQNNILNLTKNALYVACHRGLVELFSSCSSGPELSASYDVYIKI